MDFTKIFDLEELLDGYMRIIALRDEVRQTGASGKVKITMSIPDTNISFTGEFPQVTVNRILKYKEDEIIQQIKSVQGDKELVVIRPS